MTLEEAIKHCEEVAEELDMKADFDTDNQTYAMSESERTELKECVKDHRQLAEWLKELKERREQDVPDTNVEDTISRKAAIDCFWTKERYFRDALDVIKDIRQLPPEQPEVVKCKDCKYFELDHFLKSDRFQIPIIVAHEVCMKWGNGCQSSIDGWCFMAERRSNERPEND